jgi:hypothetical protein
LYKHSRFEEGTGYKSNGDDDGSNVDGYDCSQRNPDDAIQHCEKDFGDF